MLLSNGVRECDRCGVVLHRDNNKCGYELCDRCNAELEERIKIRFMGKKVRCS